MKITKFGHSCLLIEEGSTRIIIDPGSYSVLPELKNIDAVLITHEHQDHFDLGHIKKIIEANPGAVIYTNSDMVAKLAVENISAHELGDGQSIDVKGVSIEGFGVDHAVIHASWPVAKNTGYMIAGKLFHPGDALHVPVKPVEILALPVVAPWSKIGETVDYLMAVKPKKAFPIHDGFLKPGLNLFGRMASAFAERCGSEWIAIEENMPIDM